MVEDSGDRWDGTLSPDEFSSCVTALCARWKVMNTHLPNWNWVPSQRIGASSNVSEIWHMRISLEFRLQLIYVLDSFDLASIFNQADGYLAMENVYVIQTNEVGMNDGFITDSF